MSELLTVAQVAGILKCSEDTVVRRFGRYKGVIDLGTGETRQKRRYRLLRIPVAVVERYLVENSGAPVKIEVPPEPQKRRRSDNWKNLAVLNLAKIGKQNECEDRQTYREIADRARLLATKVPEHFWKEICSTGWLDDED